MESQRTEMSDISTLLNKLSAVQMSDSPLFEEALETLEETRREMVKLLMDDFREKQARLEQDFATLGALNGQRFAEAYLDAFLNAYSETIQQACDVVVRQASGKS